MAQSTRKYQQRPDIAEVIKVQQEKLTYLYHQKQQPNKAMSEGGKNE